MRNRILAKVLVTLCVVGLTYVVTSSIMAQGKKRSKAGTSSVGVADVTLRKTLTTEEGDFNPATIPPVNYINQPPLASFAMKSVSVETNGNFAVVNAAVEITDRRGGMSYVWRVRAVPEDGSDPIVKVYDTQIFQVDSNRTANPTFQEVIELKPGVHTVEIALYSFQKDAGLGFFETEEKAAAAERLRTRRKVVIAE